MSHFFGVPLVESSSSIVRNCEEEEERNQIFAFSFFSRSIEKKAPQSRNLGDNLSR